MNTLYPWKVFSLVAEYKSFRKTAIALNVSPSAISHVIAKLEEEHGFFLFVRNRSEVELTANGKHLLHSVRNVLNCCDYLDQELLNLKNISAGEVRIAGFNSACAMWMPEILRRFTACYPDVKVTVFQSGDRTIRQMVDNGEIDLAFLSQDAAEGYTFLPLHRTPLICLAPRDFIPANGYCVTSKDLQSYPLIVQAEGYDTEMKPYISAQDIRKNILYRIEVDSTCHEYVEQGLGLCITPKMTFDCNPKAVSHWPIRPKAHRTVGLVTVYPDFITPAAKLLREQIVAYMTETGLYNL